MTRSMVASYYESLTPQELRIALPALCHAIVAHVNSNWEPDPELGLPADEISDVFEPEEEPICLTPEHAATILVSGVGSNSKINIFAVAAAYLHTLGSLRLTAYEYAYSMQQNGVLGTIINSETMHTITMHQLIDKIHGNKWLEKFWNEIVFDDSEMEVEMEINEFGDEYF